MFAVTGVTGLTGGCVARALQTEGIPFRGLARNPTKAPDLGANEIVQADLADHSSLVPALAGVKGAYLVTPPALDKVDLQTNFITAAAEAGVEHIVKLSIPWAGEFPEVKLCQMHGEVEQAVEDAGLQMTSLRPFAFMQNTFGDAATVQQGQLFNPLPPEARLPLVDARDIADCAVAALQNKTPGAFELVGDAVTQPEVAGILGRHIGRNVEHVQVTPEQAMEGMLAAGYPEWLAHDFGTFVGRAVAEQPTSDAISRLAGQAPRSYEDFVADHVEQFRTPVTV